MKRNRKSYHLIKNKKNSTGYKLDALKTAADWHGWMACVLSNILILYLFIYFYSEFCII